MRTLLLIALLATPVSAQTLPNVIELGLPNPELNVVWPFEGGPFAGVFVVETKNVTYTPELATNPVQAFAVGQDAAGGPLVQNEGHIHGWVFKVDRWGRLKRDDAGKPTPASYLRFYGAGGSDYFGDDKRAYYVKTDDLPRGRYKAFFQLQQNDHTAMRQASAPAFPGIASVTFFVW